MPIIHHELIERGEIGIWKIVEELEELLLLADLSAKDQEVLSGISAFHRKKEWLATRALLRKLSDDRLQIGYFDDGRPHLENSPINLSISHSKNYAAIFLHTGSLPGIDIELLSRKVGKVADRFLTREELLACEKLGNKSNLGLLLHWCAKEAVFKMVPYKDIDFAVDIQIIIDEFDTDSGVFTGLFLKNNHRFTIPLYYKILDDVLVVFGWINENEFKV